MGDLNKAEVHSGWLHVQKCPRVLIKGTGILFTSTTEVKG